MIILNNPQEIVNNKNDYPHHSSITLNSIFKSHTMPCVFCGILLNLHV